LTLVILAGSAILAYDHRKKELLSKEQNKFDEQARSLTTSIATIVINGMARLFPDWLVNLEKKKSFPSTKHDVVMEAFYGVLEIATTGVPIALVWVLKGKNAFLPLYIVILPMFWNSWYLFWTIKTLVVSIAPWAQFADFLNNSKPPPTDLIKPKDPADMMPIFSDKEIKEIRLTGISGCGKSTMIKKIISQICDKFMSGFVIYLEQLASLPIGMTLREYFASSFSNPDVPPDSFQNKLFEYANMLNLSNIVNLTTLEQPFEKPSGGEIKRLIFLREVLPILMENSHCMILFADESSAGLDEQSFSTLRVLIEEIKARGVRVVSIDHHDYSTNLSVEVFKKKVQIPNPKSKKVMPSLLQKMMQKLFPFRYQEEKEPDLEMGEGATNIVVWAPALGIEEPQ
jgi:ABC-type lipoprotein export system ATPase subunit